MLIPKPPVESEVEFRFKSDPVLREHYRNPWSGVRIGRVLEDMDSLAGFVSYQHCDDADPTTRPPVLVTATVEAIRMNQAGLTLNEDMKMTGRVIWTGRSSLDIQLEVKQAGKTAITALFTFVARQALGGGSQAINPVVPQTEEDKKLYAQRQATADARKAARAAEAEHLNCAYQSAMHFAFLLLGH